MNQNNKVSIFLFAAGLGTRLKPHTDKWPKPVIPLLGSPLGYYTLPYLLKMNFTKIVINTFHLPEAIHKIYKDLEKVSISNQSLPAYRQDQTNQYEAKEDILKNKIYFSDEKDFIRGSAGGLKFAENLIDKDVPILCVNADEVIITENRSFLEGAIAQHYVNKNLATLVVMKHELAGTKFGAIWCDEKMQVHHIGKISENWKNKDNLKPYHFVGIQVLDPKILSSLDDSKEQNIFYDYLLLQLKTQKVEAFEIQADWYETGNLKDYLESKEKILQKKHQSAYESFFQELKKLPLSQIDDLS